MNRTWLLCGLCALAGFSAMGQTGPAPVPAGIDWRFAQPDADIKMGIDVPALLKSEIVAKAIEQAKAQAKDQAGQIDLAMGMVRMIGHVGISGRQLGPNDVDVLAEITGSFPAAMVTGMFPSTGKNKVKVIGPNTILIGTGESFDRAVERISAGSPSAPGGGLEQDDLWIQAGGALLSQGTSMAAQSGQPLPPFLKDLKGAAVGLTLSTSPQVDLQLTTGDEASAGQMLQTLQQLALAVPATNPNSGLDLKRDGSRVSIHAVIPPEAMAMLQQRLAAGGSGGGIPGGLPPQLAPLLGGFGLGGPSAAPSAAAPSSRRAAEPPPQNDGKIKIYGLDEGTKEIPLTK